MTVITLQDQLEFAEKCLRLMIEKNRGKGEIMLQESICYTIKGRIEAKADVKG